MYYADSSVLIKHHIPERGTSWVRSLTDATSGHRISTSFITQIEGISAFNRRIREGTTDSAAYSVMVEDWMKFCASRYSLIEMSPLIVVQSRRLLEMYPLRAYDAVQLASAVVTNQAITVGGRPPLVFLASDRRLLDAARGEGFEVDDPNFHP